MVITNFDNQRLAVVLCILSQSYATTRCLLIRNYKCVMNKMPCDKDFGYVTVT